MSQRKAFLETFCPFLTNQDIENEASTLNGYNLSDLVAYCRKRRNATDGCKSNNNSSVRSSDIEVIRWSDIGGHDHAKVWKFLN